MKKSILFAFISTCLFSFHLQAQSYFQAKVGAVVANVNNTVNGTEIDTKSNLDLQIGIGLELGIIPSFSIQPEVMYLGRSYKADILGQEVSQNFAYIDVGALAKLRFGSENPINAYIGAGPFLNYAVSGKIKIAGVEDKIDFDQDGIKRTDFSIAAALGLNFNLSDLGFFADVRYILGLGDLDENPDREVKNRTIGITAGIMVPLSD
ncbi:MAG: PorT family protein [Saprospiraceae bacterium]|nr:PorT family protein [Saprospiraceae bacterium]